MKSERLESRLLLAGTPIASGQSVVATLGSGQVHTYTVSLPSKARGFVVAVGATTGGGFAPAASSALSSTTPVLGGPRVFTTTAGGSYDFTVSAGAATGTYRVTAFIPNVPQFDDDPGEFVDTRDSEDINSGQRYAATIEPGDLDLFRIDAETANRFSVTLTENTAGDPIEPVLLLMDNDGILIDAAWSESGVRLEAEGTPTKRYWAIVAERSGATGLYGITAVRLPGEQYAGDPDTAPLAAGAVRNGDIPPGDVDVFTLQIDAGVDLQFNVVGATGSDIEPSLRLYDGQGTLWATAGPSFVGNVGQAALNHRISIGGTYYVVVEDFEADDGGLVTIQYFLSQGNGLAGPVVDRRLVINGTSGADHIVVRDGGAPIDTVGAEVINVTINGTLKQYYAREVDVIEIYSGGGDDYISARGENDTNNTIRPLYVSAGPGDDHVYGGDGDDSLVGGGGRNRLFGGDGKDRLRGSNGRDFLYGEGGDDRLYGEAGNDYLDGGGNKDRLYGGDGDDSLQGGNQNDQMYGHAGNDTFLGGRGDDKFDGGPGIDLVRQREPGDILIDIELEE